MKAVFLLCGVAVHLTGAYFTGPAQVSWDDARAYCQGLGSELASIHSAAQQTEAMAVCDAHASNDNTCSIGARCTNVANVWVWAWDDQTPKDYGFDNNGAATQGQYPWGSGDCAGEECLGMLLNYNGMWDDIGCNGGSNSYYMNPPLCNGDSNCNLNALDQDCTDDAGCPFCMKCCAGTSKCHFKPEYNPAAAKSVVNNMDIDNNKNNFVADPNDVTRHVSNKKGFYEHKNYVAYILLVGAVLFILINNCFIGYWCVCQKNNKQENYEKCDVIVS